MSQPIQQIFPLIEQFTSFQGEGRFMGVKATFIRLAGCNLRCPWCDSKETWSGESNMKRSIKEIVLDCEAELVVITGGEPNLHELEDLIEALHQAGKFVAMETNGTLPTPSNIDWVAASPKPQSNWEIHEECKFDELKYVIDDVITPDKIADTEKAVWLQPQGYKMQESMKKVLEFQKELPTARVGIQLHKIYKAQ